MIFRKSRRAQSKTDFSTWVEDRYSNTLTRYDVGMSRATQMLTFGDRARILTPREWERLQGFPDDWTDVGISDNERYKLLGNAVSTNVSEWIGHRMSAIPVLAAA